jgi:hypothetical protein
VSLNLPLAKEYYKHINKLKEDLALQENISLQHLISLQDVLIVEKTEDTVSQEEEIKVIVNQALDSLNAMREAEEYDFTVLSYPKGTPKTVQEASSQAVSKLGLNQLNLQSPLSKQSLSQDIIAKSVPVASSGQSLDQMTKQLQKQIQEQKLESVSRSNYRRGNSDELPRSKKRRRVGGFLDYGQVFRGWPVRKPTQLLRTNFGMGKSPAKRFNVPQRSTFPDFNVWGKRTNRQSRSHARNRKR